MRGFTNEENKQEVLRLPLELGFQATILPQGEVIRYLSPMDESSRLGERPENCRGILVLQCAQRASVFMLACSSHVARIEPQAQDERQQLLCGVVWPARSVSSHAACAVNLHHWSEKTRWQLA